MITRFPIFIRLFIVTCIVGAMPICSFGQIPPSIASQTSNEQILDFIERWRQAWQGKKLEEYISYYAEDFKEGNKDLRAWRQHKKYLNGKYKTINVSVDEIKIDLQKNAATVQFYQVYKSDKYFEEGYKLLVLTYTDEKGWQILREIWLN